MHYAGYTIAWIRSPWWDGFWILSGLPVGLLLLFMPSTALLAFFVLVVLLETGHSFSPIVLAWSHSGFRRLILADPKKYILLPGAIFMTALGVGAATSWGWTSFRTDLPHQVFRLTDWRNPFPVVVWTYWVWNIYHFGMQNFGVVQLYRRNGPCDRQRRLVYKFSCLAITAFGMAALPAITHSSWMAFLFLGVFSFNHWMTSIGLCSATSQRGWPFIAAILLLGTVGFVWMVPTSAGNAIRVIPVIICARMGLGFVHFLYDRYIWKLSDPQVRATIGADLFRERSRASSRSIMV